MHCPDRKQISYIILRNQVTCLLKIALVSRITVVTKENGLFLLKRDCCFIEKATIGQKKAWRTGKGAWRYKKRAWRSAILKGPRGNTKVLGSGVKQFLRLRSNII